MSNVTAEMASAGLLEAYLRREEAKTEQLGLELTALIARKLADQRSEELDQLVRTLGPVIQAADARGTERPGMQWRRMAQLATMLRDHPQQLEVQRWLHRNSVHGQLLRLIRDEPGITVSVLAQRADKRKVNHVSNALSRLEAAGYITRTVSGRQRYLFLSPLAKKKLALHESTYAELINAYQATGSIDKPTEESVFFALPRRDARTLQLNPGTPMRKRRAGRKIVHRDQAHPVEIQHEVLLQKVAAIKVNPFEGIRIKVSNFQGSHSKVTKESVPYYRIHSQGFGAINEVATATAILDESRTHDSDIEAGFNAYYLNIASDFTDTTRGFKRSYKPPRKQGIRDFSESRHKSLFLKY